MHKIFFSIQYKESIIKSKIIFDLTDGTADICFGTPSINDWKECSLKTPIGNGNIEAISEIKIQDFHNRLKSVIFKPHMKLLESTLKFDTISQF